MKPIPLVLTTLSLGAMIGISGMHFHHVQTMVKYGVPAVQQPTDEPLNGRPADAERLRMQEPLDPPTSTLAKHTPQPLPLGQANSQRDDAVLEMLIAMRQEQKRMREQLSETNREMTEIAFQVDSHSSEFRPLRVEQDSRPRALDTSEDEKNHSLLPPKR